MKIVLLADTHYGARADNIHIIDYQKKFLHNVLFPYCEMEHIDTLIHLGDLTDDRKRLNLNAGDRLKSDFLAPVKNQFKEVYWNIGNHDIYFKTNLSVNSQSLLEVDGMVINKPYFNSLHNFTIIPWICADNRDSISAFVKETPARYCFGHFELAGFPQNHSRSLSHGDDPAFLSGYEKVFSGHFHTRSKVGNINYIGSAFHFNWGDIVTPWRGFAILETETGKVQYIKNPYHIFTVIHYNEDFPPQDLSQYKNTYCRVFITSKTSDTKFKDFIKKIKDLGVIDLQIIEQEIEDGSSTSEVNFATLDQKEIFRQTIKELDYHDQEGVLSIFEKLYERAENDATV